jgi:hypothetical protein
VTNRIVVQRIYDLEKRIQLAKKIAGISRAGYRVNAFKTKILKKILDNKCIYFNIEKLKRTSGLLYGS